MLFFIKPFLLIRNSCQNFFCSHFYFQRSLKGVKTLKLKLKSESLQSVSKAAYDKRHRFPRNPIMFLECGGNEAGQDALNNFIHKTSPESTKLINPLPFYNTNEYSDSDSNFKKLKMGIKVSMWFGDQKVVATKTMIDFIKLYVNNNKNKNSSKTKSKARLVTQPLQVLGVRF